MPTKSNEYGQYKDSYKPNIKNCLDATLLVSQTPFK